MKAKVNSLKFNWFQVCYILFVKIPHSVYIYIYIFFHIILLMPVAITCTISCIAFPSARSFLTPLIIICKCIVHCASGVSVFDCIMCRRIIAASTRGRPIRFHSVFFTWTQSWSVVGITAWAEIRDGAFPGTETRQDINGIACVQILHQAAKRLINHKFIILILSKIYIIYQLIKIIQRRCICQLYIS